jgi:U2 small nuclear ribonucleoprotein A'
LVDSAPNLRSIVFTENELGSFDALRPLQGLVHLTRLSLIDNPLMALPDARLAIIQLLPQLRVLNFQRVRQRERAAALAKFGASKLPSRKRGLSAIAGKGSAAATSSGGSKAPSQPIKRTKLSTAQQAELAQKIANATSMEEIARLEAALRENRMPE